MDNYKTFEKYLNEAKEASKTFQGWDFGYLTKDNRMVELPLTWNYKSIVRKYIKSSKTFLDMGTGGGEVLSTLTPLPLKSYATEQYPPNVPVATERLSHLGVEVIAIEPEDEPPYNDNLPFEDGYFDLIINRHEAYSPREIRRILNDTSFFITQQVGSLTCINLIQWLKKDRKFNISDWNLNSASKEIESAKLNIDKDYEEVSFIRFYDIGAIVYYLMTIPWIIKDFSIENYKEELYDLHNFIVRNGYFDMINSKFLIICSK